jgi:integrase
MRGRELTGGHYLRGKTYWIWYQAGGERVFESAKTRNERAAMSLLTQRNREIAAGTWTKPSAATERTTFTAYLARWIARREEAAVHNVRDEARWMRTLAEPVIGKLRMGDVERRHVVKVWERIKAARHHQTGEPWSTRTQLHAYTTLRTLFADAVLDGMIAVSPCTLRARRGELPTKEDLDPAWRSEAVYSRDEAAALLFDTRTAIDRRALYALMILCGMRAEEANGRRWRDYEPDAQPLGRMTVRSQADGADAEKRTKTKKVRVVPVTPELAEILAAWRESFAMIFKRAPLPDDPIVPSRRGVDRFRIKTHAQLRADLERIGQRVPPATRHAMRATFLTLCEAAGADIAIVKRATHGAPTDVIGGYVRTQWPELCREVGKLRLRDNPCDTWPGDDVPPNQNGPFRTPGAGLEAAPSPRLTGIRAHFRDAGHLIAPWRGRSDAPLSFAAMQPVTHVTALSQDCLPFAAWHPSFDLYLANGEWS